MARSCCLVLLFSVFFFCAGMAEARAETCSSEPVTEEGGTHRCYADGGRGRIHVWIPDGFDPKTAVTVVYVHGFNLGDDHCPDARYLDCLWEAHALAFQFSKSRLNALFVAVEGPVRSGRRVKWTSLGALLRVVQRRSGLAPPMPVVAVAHSAGIYTVLHFLGDARLRHVIALDALYQRSSKAIEKWYRGSESRILTLVGAASRFAQVSALGRKLLCTMIGDVLGPYPGARCVSAIDPEINHMELIRGLHALPSGLARAGAPLP